MVAVSGEGLAGAYLSANVLEPSEQVRWTGRPGVLACMARGWRLFIFGTFLTVFSSVGAAASLSETGIVRFLVVGPFVIVGIVIATVPLQFAILASRTYYVITDRRVIVLVRFFGEMVQSYFAEDVRYFETIDQGSDHGSILLRFSSVWRAWPAFPHTLYLNGGLWGVDRLSEAARAIQRFKMADWEE